VEIVLGGWLVISPFLFRHPEDERAFWWTDLGAGVLVTLFALLSWRRRLRRAHLLSIAVALWLVAFGFLASPHPPPPALQNDIVVGLLLLTFAIVPSEASRPPAAWRDFPEGGGPAPGGTAA
jgi:peptidoglycan/LPS O-acetylase OafA/YrhL